jgi:K+-transporting ATPase ATPase A chain
MRWVEYLVFLALVIGMARPVGLYLARVFEGAPTFLDPALLPIESLLYRLLGVHKRREMSARRYTQ